MENPFDDLAKSLVGSVSRRETLRRLSSGLAGALLASLGLVKSAQADSSRCLAGCDNSHSICGYETCVSICLCQAACDPLPDRNFCFSECAQCKAKGGIVCVGGPHGFVCCPRGTLCGVGGQCIPA